MFSLHIRSIGHYQCKPVPGWDVVHSTFCSTEVCSLPVVCILGVTPAGQETCLHVHGVYPYLLIPVTGSRPDHSYLLTFVASLNRAINTATCTALSTQHVFSISIISGISQSDNREVQQFMKVCFYNPDIVVRASHLLQDGAVLNTCFQPLGTHIPFVLQFLLDHHVYNVNHIHASAVRFRRPQQGLEDGQGNKVSRLTKDDVSCTNSSGSVKDGVSCANSVLQSVEWRSLCELYSTSSPSPCDVCTSAGCEPLWRSDNMSSNMILPATVERLSVCELEVDVMAADILPAHTARDKESGDLSLTEVWTGLMEERQQHLWPVTDHPLFSCLPLDSTRSTSGEQRVPVKIDTIDECAMDISDSDDDEGEEEEEEDDEEDDDDDNGNIPQLDGTSDETTAPKKPSKKRGKGSKQSANSSGLGREDSSSQGEGSNPSCSPHVQSPVMMGAGAETVGREPAMTSPYRHQPGAFPYQAGYYRQWGEAGMAPGMNPMSTYPGYSAAGWGQSPPPQGAHPFMHRLPGNGFGYYPYPQRYPYSPAFRQNGTQNSRQQANFSPPVRSPMSPPSSYPSNGPYPHPHASSSPQQYSHFMSPQATAMRRHSDGGVATQDRQVPGHPAWQYSMQAFGGWGYSQGMPMQGMPQGSAQSMPTTSALGMLPGSTVGMPTGSTQGMPSTSVQGMPPGSTQSMASGSTQGMPTGSTQGMPSVSTQNMAPVPTQGIPSGSSHGMSSGFAQSISPGSVQDMCSGGAQSIAPGAAQSTPLGTPQSLPTGVTQSMASASTQGLSSRATQDVPSRSVQGLSSGPAPGMQSDCSQAVSSGSIQDLLSESSQGISSGSGQSISTGSVQGPLSESAVSTPTGSVQGIPSGSELDTPSSAQTVPVDSVQGQPCLGSLPARATGPSQLTASESVMDTTPGPTGGPSPSASQSSVNTPAGSVNSQPGVSDGCSSDVPAQSSNRSDINCSSSGSDPCPETSQVTSRNCFDGSSGTCSMPPVSSQCVSADTATSGPQSDSLRTASGMSASPSVAVSSASCSSTLTTTNSSMPSHSTSTVPPQSSSVASSGSSVPSGYVQSGPGPSVPAGLCSTGSGGSFQDASSNWWYSQFPQGPRPMHGSTPMGYGPFNPMHAHPMAHRFMGPMQSPPGQRMTGPVTKTQTVVGQGPVHNTPHCAGGQGPQSSAQLNNQTATGPRLPGPAHPMHSPPGPRVDSSYSGHNPNYPFPWDSRRSDSSSGASESSGRQNSDGNRWQTGGKSSTLQSLLSAPDSSKGASSHSGPSPTTCYPRRAMSMDCSPSDMYPSPSRGPEWGEAGRQEFKQPQKRSGSFSSPLGFSGGGGGSGGGGSGGGVPSALSNLYNFVSNVDPMARTPTPTSRNSTPSSTPHSDPSPLTGQRVDEDGGSTDMGVGQGKWQPQPPPCQPPTTRSLSVDEVSGGVARLPPSLSPILCSSRDSSQSTISVSREQTVDSPNSSTMSLPSADYDMANSQDSAADTQVIMCNKEVSCNSLDGPELTSKSPTSKSPTSKSPTSKSPTSKSPTSKSPAKHSKKDTVAKHSAISSAKTDSKDTDTKPLRLSICKTDSKYTVTKIPVVNLSKKDSAVSSSAHSSGPSVVPDRPVKHGRMKKGLNRSRQLSAESTVSLPAVPSPCPAYTFTFHVPTPVYKRFKMHAVFPDKVSPDVRFVRMHPMDARRYSLLKIGRELVRMKCVPPEELPAASTDSCVEDGGSVSDDHHSLIDPHTGELLANLPGAESTEETGTVSQSDNDRQNTLSHLLGPDYKPTRLTTEGSCQTSSVKQDPSLTDRLKGKQEMQFKNDANKSSRFPTVSHSMNASTVTSPSHHMHHSGPSPVFSNAGQSWQAMDRDRRPSVKVEYPAQTAGGEQWQCGQPPANTWSMWGYGQWGNQWPNSGQPHGWNPQEGQSYTYNPWVAGGSGGSFQQPPASNMYQGNAWSAPPSAMSSPTQPSVSTSQCPSTQASSTPSGGQRSMGPMSQGPAYPHNYPNYGYGMYNQQMTFPSPAQHSNAGGKFTPHSSAGLGTEPFPYQGVPGPQGYSQSMYQANYPGYQSAGRGKEGGGQPGYGVQQQSGGMTGQYMDSQQYQQYSSQSPGGYAAPGSVSNPSAPGPAQFVPHPAQFPASSNQAVPFSAPSEQSGQFSFPSSQFAGQSGQFPAISQVGGVSLQSGQSAYSPPHTTGHGTDQHPLSSDTGSQGRSSQQSRECVTQQTQSSVTSPHQDSRLSHAEGNNGSSGNPAVSSCSMASQEVHTIQQDSFLTQAACQASTPTVCDGSEPGAQDRQSDRPADNSLVNNTDTASITTPGQLINTSGVGAHCAKRVSHDDDESAALHSVDNSGGSKDQKPSYKCSLKGKGSCSSDSNKHPQINCMTFTRQNIRRSSVQLCSDGYSDSAEDDSDDEEESSDDYQPSCNSRRKGQKRKGRRRGGRSEVKRTKRSSVNYSAHAFSKYLDHGIDFDKKNSRRQKRSHGHRVKRKKGRRKKGSLIEGVHYIVVGKFKGHRVMLVKVDKVKVKVDERVRVSDWSGSQSKMTPGRCRLLGPRCHRIAKGASPDDPCFVHAGDLEDSESGAEGLVDCSLKEKDNSTQPNSNHRIMSAACTQREEGSCDVKKAIKQETVDAEDAVWHMTSHSLIKSERLDSADKGETGEDCVKASCEMIKTEVDTAPDNDKCEGNGCPVRTQDCEDVQSQTVKGVGREDPAQSEHDVVDSTAVLAVKEESVHEDDSSETLEYSTPHSHTPDSLVAESQAVDDGGDTALPADSKDTQPQPASQVQSPDSLSGNGHSGEKTSTVVSLSLLEGKAAC